MSNPSPGVNHRPSVTLAALLLLQACTFNHNMNLTPKLDRLEVPAQVTTPVAIYYSPELRTATYARLFGPHRYRYAIGADSVAMLDVVAARAFATSSRLEALPPFGPAAPPGTVIVEPELEAFHFQLGLEADEPEHAIRYRLHFYAADGTPRGTRLVIGKEVPPRSHLTVFDRVDDNMDDAAVRVLRELLAVEQLPPAPASGPATAPGGGPAGLVLSASPVASPLRLGPALAIPLAEAGVVALAVSARNDGGGKVTISAADARLVLEGGRSVGTSEPSAIPSRVEQRSYAGDAAAGLAGAPVGVLVMFAQASEARDRRLLLLDALRRSAFGDRSLAPGEVAEGALYFTPAEGTQPFDAATLSLWIIEEGGRRAWRATVPVTGLAFGSPAKPPTATAAPPPVRP